MVENNGFHLQMKAFDHYFGLRGLLDEVEVFIWPNLTETDNLAESLSDNDTAARLSSSLSDEDYVSGRLSRYQANLLTACARCFLSVEDIFIMRQPLPALAYRRTSPLATGNTQPLRHTPASE